MFNRRTISSVLAWRVTLAFSCIFAVAAAIHWHIREEIESEEIKVRANSTSENFLSSVGPMLWNMDQRGIRELLQVYSQSDSIESISIKDAFEEFTFTKSISVSSCAKISRSYQVEYSGEKLGNLQMDFCFDKAPLHQSLFVTLAFVFSAIIVINAAVWIFLTRMLQFPLGNIESALKKYTDGKYDTALSDAQYSDMQAIHDAINNMVRTITDRGKKIEKNRQYLQSLNDITLSIFSAETLEALTISLNQALYAHVSDWDESLLSVERNTFIVDTKNMESELVDKTKQIMMIANQAAERLARIHESLDLRYNLLKSEALAQQVIRATQMLAHDIRKPMALMNMIFREITQSDHFAENTGMFSKYKETLDLSFKAVDEMIADVLNLKQKISLTVESIEISKLVGESLVSVFGGLDNSGGEVSLNFKWGHNLKVNGDHAKILRVLNNVIENAYQAMDGRGEICVSTKQLGKHIEVSVFNTGKPIENSKKDQIFEPFFSMGKKSGTGLGLAIARQIIEAHGGTIRAEPLRDGTVFYIILPSSDENANIVTNLPARVSDLTKDRPLAVHSRADTLMTVTRHKENALSKAIANHVSPKSINLLCIDDEEIFSDAIESQIIGIAWLNESVNVDWAPNLESALERISNDSIGLIICDLDFGPLHPDGFHVIREIRKAGFTGYIAVNTAAFGESLQRESTKAGANIFLSKPVSRYQLLSIISSALGLSSKDIVHLKADRSGRFNIALIEDDEVTMDLWSYKLSDTSLWKFADPESFAKAVIEQKLEFDFVVTDFVFSSSDKNGYDVLSTCKSLLHAKVIVSSNYPDMPAGFDYYVDKELNGLKDFFKTMTREGA